MRKGSKMKQMNVSSIINSTMIVCHNTTMQITEVQLVICNICNFVSRQKCVYLMTVSVIRVIHSQWSVNKIWSICRIMLMGELKY